MAGQGPFPLPYLGVAASTGDSGASACLARGSQQRHSKRRAINTEVNRIIRSINELAGFHVELPRGESSFGASCWADEVIAPTEAQASAHCILGNAVRDCPPPNDEKVTPREAFLMLRGDRGSDYGLPTNLASYQKGKVSIPEQAGEAVDLSLLLREPIENRWSILSVLLYWHLNSIRND